MAWRSRLLSTDHPGDHHAGTGHSTRDLGRRHGAGPAGVLLPGRENYYFGGRRDLEVGNTEVLAGIIAELIDCDVYRIEAADPYPASYDDTVQRNVTEQNSDARQGIANPLTSIAGYDTVLLGSPIWNVQAPMIMTTFTDGHDFTGKTVLPFVTYAVSGLGSVQRDYAAACPGARISDGLAVRGEEVAKHRADGESWLRAAGLRTQ
jgi:flavodoxin